MCQKKSKIDTTIDFVKIPNIQETTSSWKLFRKIIWNREIIMLVVRLIRTWREIQDKNMSCLILRFSRKSNKSRVLSWLTGTKTSVVEKRTNSFTDLFFFLGANLKVSKILLLTLRASFSKNEKLFIWKKANQSPKHRDLAFFFSETRLSFLPTLSQKKKPEPWT
jgi:hypothetical protein